MRHARGVYRLLWSLALLAPVAATLPGCSRKQERVGRPHDVLTLEIKDETLVTEVASDFPSRQLGLMRREQLPENHAMLFIFRYSATQSFWMKDTLIPLSIAFINDDGEVLQIEHMKPKDLTSTRSKHKVRYALEVNKGWFARHGIGVGDKFKDFRDKVSRFRAS